MVERSTSRPTFPAGRVVRRHGDSGARSGHLGDEPGASEAPTRGLLTPTVRAPAEVPYPRRIHDVEPRVPSSAAARRGIAILALLIDTAGNVAEVETLRGVDPELDAAAIGAARLWKFEPTMHKGRPVAVRGNFSVTFGYQ